MIPHRFNDPTDICAFQYSIALVRLTAATTGDWLGKYSFHWAEVLGSSASRRHSTLHYPIFLMTGMTAFFSGPP